MVLNVETVVITRKIRALNLNWILTIKSILNCVDCISVFTNKRAIANSSNKLWKSALIYLHAHIYNLIKIYIWPNLKATLIVLYWQRTKYMIITVLSFVNIILSRSKHRGESVNAIWIYINLSAYFQNLTSKIQLEF